LHPSEADIIAVVEGVIGAGRPIGLVYNFDLGIIFSVDLPDASQAEADAVSAALVAAFPDETSGGNEPHAVLNLLDNLITWAAMPAALTELLGLARLRSAGSLQKVNQVRIVANVLTAGAAGSVLRAQWSTGAAFAAFDAGTNGPEMAIDSTGFKRSPWVSVPIAARADAALRIVGVGGNGVTSPQFGLVLIEGR
jgi:hypothetical protein